MKKLILLIVLILGIITIACDKQEKFISYSDISISTSRGLGVWADEASDVVITDSSVRFYHDKQIWSFWVNNGLETIYISYRGKSYILESEDKLSLPLILY